MPRDARSFDHACEECQQPFTSNRRKQRFCSLACNKKNLGKRAQTAGYKPPQRKLRCPFCGQDFVTRRSCMTYCSKTCGVRAVAVSTAHVRKMQRDARALRVEAERAERRHRRQVEQAAKRAQAAAVQPRHCIQCGITFTPQHRGRHLCSAECRRLNTREAAHRSKQARRAQKRSSPLVEMVYRKRIFQRDGFRCQLCGKRLAMTQQVPHPKAPTLDHIVPLSVGGSHTPANVQAAHFICNSRKHTGTGPNGDQLRLVG